MKEILIDIDDWALCKHTADTHPNHVTVYAEHVIDCNEVSYDNASAWGWEHDDGMGVDGYESCWKCTARVPKELVALVLLYNWGRKGRFE